MKPINRDQLFSAGYLSLSVTSLSFGSHCRNISAGKRKLTTLPRNLVNMLNQVSNRMMEK